MPGAERVHLLSYKSVFFSHQKSILDYLKPKKYSLKAKLITFHFYVNQLFSADATMQCIESLIFDLTNHKKVECFSKIEEILPFALTSNMVA